MRTQPGMCFGWLPVLIILVAVGEAVAAGRESNSPGEAVEAPSPRDITPRAYPGLHQVVAYGEKVISGAVPEGKDGFRSLAALGVKAIISVDGAQPQVELAKKHGLRYIHLPITYSGIDNDRKLQLARAVQTIDGPIYIHCHHGKHRSAGAAAAATAQLRLLTSQEALARMKVSETSPSYPGLYACALSKPVDEMTLARVSTDFPERAIVSGMVETMVAIDVSTAHLKAIAAADWSIPEDHPDLVPAAEAGRLVDLFRQLLDDPEARDRPDDFQGMLEAQIVAAKELETALTTGESPARLTKKWAATRQACVTCHARYRDE